MLPDRNVPAQARLALQARTPAERSGGTGPQAVHVVGAGLPVRFTPPETADPYKEEGQRLPPHPSKGPVGAEV